MILCGTIAAAAFVSMHFWTMPRIRAGAGGLDIFDLWMNGYPPSYAHLFLDRLSPEARALYLGPQRLLDTIMPIALTGFLAALGYLLTRRWSWWLAIGLTLFPLVYFTFDMLENAQVAAMLRAPSVPDRMAEVASRFTVLKAETLRLAVAAVTFTAVLRGALSAARLWRKEEARWHSR